MKKYKLFLFDFDGTLINSSVGIINAVKYALSKFNIIETNEVVLNDFIGDELRYCFKKHYQFNGQKLDNAVRFYREYYSSEGIYENNLYDYVIPVINKLKDKGKIIVLVTSRLKIFADRILKSYDIDKYFNYIVGCGLNESENTKEEMIRTAVGLYCNNNNLSIENVVFIGDRGCDINSAKKINIDSIGVLRGVGNINEMKESNPTGMVNNFEELYEMIDDIS